MTAANRPLLVVLDQCILEYPVTSLGSRILLPLCTAALSCSVQNDADLGAPDTAERATKLKENHRPREWRKMQAILRLGEKIARGDA